MRKPFLLLLAALSLIFTGDLEGIAAETRGAGDRVIFYLHGKIVEDQGPDAESDRFGPYEYAAILKALGRDGHRVVSEVRKPRTAPWEYAKKVAAEIEELKKTGVPSRNITVVGASKGAAIAVLVSHLLKDADINYVLLAICSPQMLEYWAKHDICVAGRILSVSEESDELAGSCSALAERCSAEVTGYREIELNLGTGHGMVYRPFEEWVAPTLEWSASGRAHRRPAEPAGP